MLVKQLKAILKQLPDNKKIHIACDEEWNMIFEGLEVVGNSDDGSYVIYPLSGTEIME
jgi:hypothetical protein